MHELLSSYWKLNENIELYKRKYLLIEQPIINWKEGICVKLKKKDFHNLKRASGNTSVCVNHIANE